MHGCNAIKYLQILGSEGDDMIHLIIGGARSGKSARAEEIAMADVGRRVVYIATAERRADDAEFAARIAAHRARRPASWETCEAEPDELPSLIAAEHGSLLLLDCMTMLLARMFFSGVDAESADELRWAEREREMLASIESILRATQDDCKLIAVTNEVGCGIVPESRLSRRFRDAQGRVNRAAAAMADRVELVVAGIPLVIKGGGA